jgi:hypothetical protein
MFVIGAGFFLWFAGSLRSFLARAYCTVTDNRYVHSPFVPSGHGWL